MYKIVSTLLILITVIYGALAQLRPITNDEVESILTTISQPELYCDTTLVLAHRLFMYRNSKDAKTHLETAIQIAKDNQLHDKLVPLLMDLSRCHEAQGDIDQAIKNNRASINYLSTNTEKYRGKLYNYLGRYYHKKDMLDSMIYYYNLTEKWNNENDPYRNWVLYEQWHQKYLDIGDLKEADKLLHKAYQITKPKSHKMDHGLVLYHLRQLSSRKGNVKDLAQYTNEYFTLLKDSEINMTHGLELAPNLTTKQKIKQYLSLIEDGNLIDIKLPNSYLYPRLIALYINDNQPEQALKYLDKIDTTNQKLLTRSDFLNLSIQAYEKTGNTKIALDKLKEKIVIDAQRGANKKAAELKKLEEKYNLIEKESEINLLKAEDTLNKQKIKQEKYSKYYLLIILTILTLFLLSLSYLLFKNRNQNNKLLENNKIINKTLKDKDILLREIHHRVKNNLQVISSLLNLQSNYINDDTALQAINDGKSRVESMALIHQYLYQRDKLTAINTKSYFEDLIDNIFDTYNVNEKSIKIEKNIEELYIDVDTMIPIGLIANELISNSLKHAFSNSGNKIFFNLCESNNTLVLSISDNGIGYDASTFLNSNTFGNKLIQVFKSKLEATIQIDNSTGGSFTMSIHHYKSLN